MKTRLDPVVKFRETREQKALEGLAKATDAAHQARLHLVAAKERALADGRGMGAAAEWAMIEVARERALVDVRKAEAAVTKSVAAVDTARSAWSSEHRQTEVVRRVANTRREEARVAEARRDARDLDEIGAMMFWRQPA